MHHLRKFAYAAFAVLLAVIVYATLVPISLRPSTGHLHPERMLAFFLLGGALGLASPDRPRFNLLLVCTLACGLEALQLFIPTRDARMADALEKSVGAVAGVVAALTLDRLLRNFLARSPSQVPCKGA